MTTKAVVFSNCIGFGLDFDVLVFESVVPVLGERIDAIVEPAVGWVSLELDDDGMAGSSGDSSYCEDDAIVAMVVLNCKTLKNYHLRGLSSGST